ncbi:uncharacterized protein LOC121377817 [Gigantopelta aegis]|uniref:uncharacterized protein LOC121377817 n=1 Tax=Gigantopelta aegis TaxID=1735272 RepID=UPI001B88E01B|nr:uncharacterized protein LOC121377817 [Gigantopelta aegis]
MSPARTAAFRTGKTGDSGQLRVGGGVEGDGGPSAGASHISALRASLGVCLNLPNSTEDQKVKLTCTINDAQGFTGKVLIIQSAGKSSQAIGYFAQMTSNCSDVMHGTTGRCGAGTNSIDSRSKKYKVFTTLARGPVDYYCQAFSGDVIYFSNAIKYPSSNYFLKKYREYRSSTSGQAASKKKKWHLYDFLTFLIPSCSTGPTSGNLQENEDDTATSGDEEQSQNSPLSMQSKDNSLAGQFKKPQRRLKRNAQSAGMSAIDMEVLKALKEPEPQQQIDDNVMFFKSLLPSLKHLDEVQTMEFRMEVQRLVLTYLRSARSNTTAVETSAVGVVSPPQATGSTTIYHLPAHRRRPQLLP